MRLVDAMKNLFRTRLSTLAITLGCLLVSPALPANADISEKDFSSSIEKYLQSDAGLEKIGTALEKYFQKKQLDSAKKQQEQEQAALEDQYKNPVKVDIGTSPIKGPANARVTIIEFSDFECPYCKRGYETMEAVMKAYPKDVKLAFKHYPLPFHKEATPAAKATWAAQQQGKFWEFHDALFNNQESLGSEFYLATAKQLNLDLKKFEADMNSEAATKSVAADAEIGAKNGIQGTPGFFVNGVAVKGAYPPEHFKTIIDRLLNGAAK